MEWVSFPKCMTHPSPMRCGRGRVRDETHLKDEVPAAGRSLYRLQAGRGFHALIRGRFKDEENRLLVARMGGPNVDQPGCFCRRPRLRQPDRFRGSRGASPRDATPRDAAERTAAGTLARQLLRQTPSLLPLAEPLTLAAQRDDRAADRRNRQRQDPPGPPHPRALRPPSTPSLGRPLRRPLTPSLVESEFFGHAKGAFTGADAAKIGKLEAVGEGTLLLDEVDALGLEQQAKLSQHHRDRRVRAGRQQRHASVPGPHHRRHDLDLEQAVEQGKFRQDLFYRLNVLTLYLPPLRKRPRDVACLARTWPHVSTVASARVCSASARRRRPCWRRFPGRATSASWKT